MENEDALRDTLKKVRARNKKLEKENRELKTKNKTLEIAFEETKKFLKDNTEGFSIEECIKAAKKKKTLKKMKETKGIMNCPSCSKEIKIIGFPNKTVYSCGECGYRRVTNHEE